MFLSTGTLNQGYIIKGIVNVTVKKEIRSDELNQIDKFDDLYELVKSKLMDKANKKSAEGIINIRFIPQIVRVSVGPKYMILHGYGTAISLLKRNN